MKRNEFNTYIKENNFNGFFIELGWNHVHSSDRINPIVIDEVSYEITPVADKQGFKVLICHNDELPQHTIRKKLDFQLRRYFHNYVLIFIKEKTEHQLWMVPIKTIEKRDLVVVEYQTAEKADFLFSKVSYFSFGLEEESTIVDVTFRVHGAFEVNAERVTKDFYTGFRKQHNSFVKFIEGITAEGDRQWYASVMLNRLMFCYFIQKKGFLNFDTDYLRNKLAWTKDKQGEDQFFGTFYKGFLSVLFHGGLNEPKHSREFESKYGRIPYLNGGLFDKHQLEEDYHKIDIPDKAFEDLFDFFDNWRWHLDTRIEASGRDINPDVLGYIFEQYINDRSQMGAYYTKEDITEYIGKNCILPFLMDETSKTASKKHFTPGGYVWETLRNSGDKYIYDAVKKGTELKDIPEEIAIGLDTSTPNLQERRKEWNKPTPETYALPTEIWRETIERRNRYYDLLHKIRNGEIKQINDFITYNLDIRQFVEDLLSSTNDHLLILHFYKALQNTTILDPTCGSGAFLFAALNILEPLYEVCINRMQEFYEKNNLLFKDQLDEMDHKYRSNIQYFIYKSIILRNLYGVDIMHEATEIARLRLFLKMVAVVDVERRADNLGLDPLPDIDFNIRCGNTLIGYATQNELDTELTYGDMFANIEFKEKISEEMQKVSMAYQHFKEIQFTQHENMEVFKTAKTELNSRLTTLNEALNQRLYASTVVGKTLSYKDWLASHQPFHWLAEFYEIIHRKNGFDVIIGNPPYVEYSSIKKKYSIKNIECLKSGNLYAFVIERCTKLMKAKSRIGMIIQLSAFCTPRMEDFQKVWFRNSSQSHISFFDDRPGKLFDGLEHIRVAICLSEKGDIENTYIGTTNYIKFKTEYRKFLFDSIHYMMNDNSRKSSSVLKVNNKCEHSIVEKIWLNSNSLSFYLTQINNSNFVYYGYGYGYFGKILNYQSYFKGEKVDSSTGDKFIYVNSDYDRDIVVGLMNSTLFYWFYVNYSDGHNFTKYVIGSFPFAFPNSTIHSVLKDLIVLLMKDLKLNSFRKTANYKSTGKVEYDEYYPKKSKSIIDEIDKVLAKHYGFTDEELDFIINYDIKYRMGSELNPEDEE